MSRSNAARSLRILGRLDEARHVAERAIACFHGFGQVAEPWKAYDILFDIERDAGRPKAASEARNRALAAYLAYRRDGGGSHKPSAEAAAYVVAAITEGNVEEVMTAIDRTAREPGSDPEFVAASSAYLAILSGSRDSALADHPELDFQDAAEIVLLLEQLAAAGI
jgi:hypothetical protein